MRPNCAPPSDPERTHARPATSIAERMSAADEGWISNDQSPWRHHAGNAAPSTTRPSSTRCWSRIRNLAVLLLPIAGAREWERNERGFVIRAEVRGAQGVCFISALASAVRASILARVHQTSVCRFIIDHQTETEFSLHSVAEPSLGESICELLEMALYSDAKASSVTLFGGDEYVTNRVHTPCREESTG